MNTDTKILELVNALEKIAEVPETAASDSRAVKEMVRIALNALESTYAEMPEIYT